MRKIMACLSLLCLPACDALWTWTAACNAGDPACSSAKNDADMSIRVSEDLAGIDLAGADLTGQPAYPDLATSPPDGGTRLPDGSTMIPDGSTMIPDGSTMTLDMVTTMTDAGPVIDDMKVVVVAARRGNR